MTHYNRGSMRLDTWLTQLLWALAKKQGGEARISLMDLEDVPGRCSVSTDYDGPTHEIVIRACSGESEMIVINTEQQWARRDTAERNSSPSPSSPQEQPRVPTEPSRGVVLDDNHMADIENRLLRRAAKRRDQLEEQEILKARRGES